MIDRNWPSYRYRRSEDGSVDARIFESADELSGAGKGWVEHPDHVDAAGKVAAAEARVAEIDAEIAAEEAAAAPKARKPRKPAE